jgi:hypothetical protein
MSLTQPPESWDFPLERKPPIAPIEPHEYQTKVTRTNVDNTADIHLPRVSFNEHSTGGHGRHEAPGHLHHFHKHWLKQHHFHPLHPPAHYQPSHSHPRYQYSHGQQPYLRSNPEWSQHQTVTQGSERPGDLKATPIPNFQTTPGRDQYGELNSFRHQVLYRSIAEFDGKSPSVLGERGLNPRLACARTVSTILHRALGLGVVDGVASLEHEMQTARSGGHFQKFAWDGTAASLQPFDVVVGHRGMGEHSHAAIYTGNGEVFNNSDIRENLSYDPVSKFNKVQSAQHRLGYANTVIYRWIPETPEKQYMASTS